MKYVILLFLLPTSGCFLCPTPNALDLKIPEPSEIGEPDFLIELENEFYFYKNEKIERSEIKDLALKFKNENKEKRKIVMKIRPAKNAKMENVVFLMELGMQEELDVIIDSKE